MPTKDEIMAPYLLILDIHTIMPPNFETTAQCLLTLYKTFTFQSVPALHFVLFFCTLHTPAVRSIRLAELALLMKYVRGQNSPQTAPRQVAVPSFLAGTGCSEHRT